MIKAIQTQNEVPSSLKSLYEIENHDQNPLFDPIKLLVPQKNYVQQGYPTKREYFKDLKASLIAKCMAVHALAILTLSRGLVFTCLWGKEDSLERGYRICTESAASFWKHSFGAFVLLLGPLLSGSLFWFLDEPKMNLLYDPELKERLSKTKEIFQEAVEAFEELSFTNPELASQARRSLEAKAPLLRNFLKLHLMFSESEIEEILKPLRKIDIQMEPKP